MNCPFSLKLSCSRDGQVLIVRSFVNVLIVSDNDAMDLKSISLPPKLKKRGRPKGADLTVIGLPRKKKCNSKPLTFLRKPCQEWDKQILSWILPDKLLKKALLGENIGKKKLLRMLSLPLICLMKTLTGHQYSVFLLKQLG